MPHTVLGLYPAQIRVVVKTPCVALALAATDEGVHAEVQALQAKRAEDDLWLHNVNSTIDKWIYNEELS